MNDSSHVCAKCGKQLDPVSWWTAGVYDRYTGEKFKLCTECAHDVRFAMQAVIESKGRVGGVVMR